MRLKDRGEAGTEVTQTSIQQVTILGATGSIGKSTLDVVLRNPDRFRIHALTANRQVDELVRMAATCHPEVLCVADPSAGNALELAVRKAGLSARIAVGPDELVEIAGDPTADIVMAAIVGAAGLAPTLAAARATRTLLLANKESIVMAGQLFLAECRRSGVCLLPIDSEHNALFQCLPAGVRASGSSAGSSAGSGTASGSGAARAGNGHSSRREPACALGPLDGVRRLVLTASGGPFRTWDAARLSSVTPDQACAHPKWSMGRKISVDSATMMNKGLELIEAHFLFGMPSEQLGVLIHPQSIVHSLVEYRDGSVLAQLGNPDMRTPIAHAMGWPERIDSGVSLLDLAQAGRLDFEAPDLQRFPCLRLAREALEAEGGAPCVLNAANEASVAAFLDERIAFTDITRINEAVVTELAGESAPASLDAALELDRAARARAESHIAGIPRC